MEDRRTEWSFTPFFSPYLATGALRSVDAETPERIAGPGLESAMANRNGLENSGFVDGGSARGRFDRSWLPRGSVDQRELLKGRNVGG